MPSLKRSPICFGWLHTMLPANSSSMSCSTTLLRLAPFASAEGAAGPLTLSGGGCKSSAKRVTLRSSSSVLHSVSPRQDSVRPEQPRRPPAPSKSRGLGASSGLDVPGVPGSSGSIGLTSSRRGARVRAKLRGPWGPSSSIDMFSLASTTSWSYSTPSIFSLPAACSIESLRLRRNSSHGYSPAPGWSGVQAWSFLLFSSQTFSVPSSSATAYE
mmetsp:Transcript_124193/g.337266  ORF Transcript_124193/g.337266 Transcript_124193/m.337266 type:complete len:214 (-) Transcript_124193:172-813(-)